MISAYDSIKPTSCRAKCKIPTIGIKEFPFLFFLFVFILCLVLFIVLCRLLFYGILALRLVWNKPAFAEKLGKIDSGSSRIRIIVVVGGETSLLFYELVEIVLHISELIGGNSEFFENVTHHIFNGQTQLLGTFHANAFADLLSVFYFGYKNHCHSFVAS